MKRSKWIKNTRKDLYCCSLCEKKYSESKSPECAKYKLCKDCLIKEHHAEILNNAVGKKNVREIFNPNRRQVIENNLPGYLPSSDRTSTRNSTWR